MPERSLEDIAAFAKAAGYETLEVAAWPSIGDRPFTASHIKADRWDDAEADRVRSALESNGPDQHHQPEPRRRLLEPRHVHARDHHRQRQPRRRLPWDHQPHGGQLQGLSVEP
jgi:hypothetical protein